MAARRFSQEERAVLMRRALEHIRGAGLWVKAYCPFCIYVVGKEDRDRTLSYNTASTGWHCWRCSTKGYMEGGREIVRFYEPTPEEVAEALAARQPPESYQPLWEGSGARSLSLEPARAYLLGRGIDEKQWERNQIGACAAGKYEGRVVVPILSTDGGEWYGWAARLWGKGPKRDKYRYPHLLVRGELLYNPGVLLIETDEPAYVVEGTFDVLGLERMGLDACGTLGEDSPEQIRALLGSRRPVVICYDGDAWRKALGLMLRLRADGQRAGAIRLPPKKDPDEMEGYALWEAGRESLARDDIVAI